MSDIHDLIDRMTEAEYLSMTDMKWVADRLREFAEEQANTPSNADMVEELKKCVSNVSPMFHHEHDTIEYIRHLLSKYRPK